MTAIAAPVMEQLKVSTAELHASAEGHAFQQQMVRGTVAKELYGKYLAQLYWVHSALESQIRAQRANDPVLASIVTDEQFHSPRIVSDLQALGVCPAGGGLLSSTKELVKTIEAASGSSIRLLGLHYVLEGSMNGNKFIAKALMRGLGLAPGNGLSYLDPYADQQRANWQRFKDSMNAADFSQAEIDEMVAAACNMFRGIGAISRDMTAA